MEKNLSCYSELIIRDQSYLLNFDSAAFCRHICLGGQLNGQLTQLTSFQSPSGRKTTGSKTGRKRVFFFFNHDKMLCHYLFNYNND